MNPQEIRTINRRAKLQKWRAKPEYRARVIALTLGMKCVWCGTTDNLQIHHTRGEVDYKSYKNYLYGLECGWVMCRRCHIFGLHKGRHLCPVCKQHLTYSEKCSYCRTPKERDEYRKKKEFWDYQRKEWRKDQYIKYKKRLTGK